jgi:Cu/Ag efflux protein CusF
MKPIATLLLAATLASSALFSPLAHAASVNTLASTPASASAMAAELTNGEVRKIDKDTGKITIKHEAIKNLDMPGMTMVFQVKDKAMLDSLHANDKIKFMANNDNGKMTVTEIQSSK